MTKDLHKHFRLVDSIAGIGISRDHDDEIAVNVRAAEKMAAIHDALKASGLDRHDLEVYLTRLLFCMFADDTGIFPKDALLQYVENSKADGSNLSERLARLFEVLNMPMEVRARRKLLSDELKQFRYINGGLFEGGLPLADFDANMRKTLIECMEYDWSKISPAIFGAMFQEVMDKTSRREFGAHYTSEENILKLIKPLFLDELREEFERVKADPKALSAFYDKLSRLKFLDPACGCGNFLIIAYRELRLLELDILRMRFGKTRQRELDTSRLMRVSAEQFYGIEISDYPCQIAQVGMWLMDHLMNMLVSEEFGCYFARLPLAKGATIVCGNALRMDWEEVVPKSELSFIMGNPPFVGYSNQTVEQKADIREVYRASDGTPFKLSGKIDYVAAWFLKAARYIAQAKVDAAFVSTSSITQGDQVAPVWIPITDIHGICIHFAYRPFKWTNEAKGKAVVHCVIIGLSNCKRGARTIYDKDTQITAANISPYLVDAKNIFVDSRRKPLCNAPNMVSGNRPADGGCLLIEDAELNAFVSADPLSKKYVRRYMMADEFIYNKKRWCLWLAGVTPAELRKMPEVMKRVEACRKARLESTDVSRNKLASTPTLFREQLAPERYLAVPFVTTERRHYIPMDFLDANTIAGDGGLFMVPEATLYHFGILTSIVHMAWMRAVCGRFGNGYRYSKDIVYNSFPWPEVTDSQRTSIKNCARSVLDVRAQYPVSSLAELYDPLTMPPGLLKAHQNMDRAVLKLYGHTRLDTPESTIVAGLFERYQQLVGDER